LLVAVVITPPDNWLAFSLYFLVLLTILLLSRIPMGYVFKRSLAIMPFVVLIAIFIPFFKEGEVAGSYNIWLWQIKVTHSGIQVLTNVLLKSWLSILSLIILTATTRVSLLLKSMGQLHVPRVMVMILSFMYRYIFILVDEVLRMKQARDSRNFGTQNKLWQIKSVGNMIGTLFIRSYERGERVYSAMLSRGFDGTIKTLSPLNFKTADAYFGISVTTVLIAVSTFSFIFQRPF
jgi:cobalt/nickel transport system permease protein